MYTTGLPLRVNRALAGMLTALGTRFTTMSMPPFMPGRSRGSFLVMLAEARKLRVGGHSVMRSEEHTSELQSLRHLVCRLLLEKKLKLTVQIHQSKDVFVVLNVTVHVAAE